MAAPRAVVVGAGGISNAWFGPLKEERVEVAGVVDLRVDAAKSRIAEHGLDAIASDDLVATIKATRPDFVVDLTVPAAHCKVTCTALRAGCHVVSEKPMAASMAEARRMVRTSRETGKLYMVSQSRRWIPHHVSASRMLRGRRIGQLTAANCEFYIGAHFGGFRDEMDSPLIVDMSIHHFDLMRYLTGADPVAVYAKEFNPAGSWYRGDVAASCIFEMSDGLIFTYMGSWCAEGMPTSWNGDWRFTGSRGSMLLEQDQAPRAEVVAGKKGFTYPVKDLKAPEVNLRAQGMHGALREMLSFLRTGKEPQTHCADNIKSFAMVLGAVESSRKGRRVKINADV